MFRSVALLLVNERRTKMGILEQLSDKIDRMNARLIEMDILLIKLSEQKEQPKDRQDKEKRIKGTMMDENPYNGD